MVSYPSVLCALVWIWCQVVLKPCNGQCLRAEYFTCYVGVINMTSDGGARLRKTIDTEDNLYSITIDKVIVTNSASGPFLQRIGAFAESIGYTSYRDPVFQLPVGNTVADIDINGAGVMRSFVAGANNDLKQLYVENCLLDRIPPTIPKLAMLEKLRVKKCALVAFRLDMIAQNRWLQMLDLSQNQIRQVFPLSSPPPQMSAIESLVLANNMLEQVDMSMFAFMPNLEWFDVRYNHIVHLEAGTSVNFINMSHLLLASNKLSSLDIASLTLPNIHSLDLALNEFTDIPHLSENLSNVTFVGLQQNKLTKLDLSLFRSLLNLEAIYVSMNQITSVFASTPVSMPFLWILSLEYNAISSFNLAGCDIPNISSVDLVDNQLTTVPTLFQRYPTVRLYLEANPIKCKTLSPFKSKMVADQLMVKTAETQAECGTTSSIVLNQYERACCNA